MNKITWAKFRTEDGSYDLFSAYEEAYGESHESAFNFIDDVTELYPVYSRQVAAITLATARQFK